MQPSWRIIFLIAAAGTALHVSALSTALVCGGYSILEYLDFRLAQKAQQRARDAVHEDEMFGWERDSEELEYEAKGEVSRLKLSDENQLVVGRVAQLLRRIPN